MTNTALVGTFETKEVDYFKRFFGASLLQISSIRELPTVISETELDILITKLDPSNNVTRQLRAPVDRRDRNIFSRYSFACHTILFGVSHDVEAPISRLACLRVALDFSYQKPRDIRKQMLTSSFKYIEERGFRVNEGAPEEIHVARGELVRQIETGGGARGLPYLYLGIQENNAPVFRKPDISADVQAIEKGEILNANARVKNMEIDSETWKQVTLAVAMIRASKKGLAWFPMPQANPVSWVRALTNWWAAEQLDGFSKFEKWSEEWLTRAERRVFEDLRRLKEERQRAFADFQSRQVLLDLELGAVTEEANRGDKRLLTCDDDELVEAVSSAFRKLGFVVENADEKYEKVGKGKREDLHLFLPGVAPRDWTCLVEVKGFKKGAKARPIMKLNTRGRIFAKENGYSPHKLMYVVNPERFLPPQHRSDNVLRGHEAEVEDFGHGDGLVVPTKELYAYLQLLPFGDDINIARNHLKEARGVFKHTVSRDSSEPA